MGFRNIMLQSPGRLWVRRQQLVFDNGCETALPMEDINGVVIENQQIVITAAALASLAEAGVCVYFCDQKHLPSAVLTPYGKYSRPLKVLGAQLKATKPQYKRLWQQIVCQKVENQATVLALTGRQQGRNHLMALAEQVRSGDSTHIEAAAAAFYFRQIFGEGFSRGMPCLINAALNYGYAILRGQIARTLALYGFEPALGICHHNALNPFNLADDLIEVYRPEVDLYVADLEKMTTAEALTPKVKQGLFRLLNMDVLSDGQHCAVYFAIDRTVQSLANVLNGEENTLKLCSILPLEIHDYE